LVGTRLSGKGLVLNGPQIRYCLSEKIRIESWEGQVSDKSAMAVSAFNAAVEFYNSRCSSYRYRTGTIESIKAQVEANRALLTQEGFDSAVRNP
jgi:hypothetical protein